MLSKNLGARVYTNQGFWCSHRYHPIIVNEFHCDARLIYQKFYLPPLVEVRYQFINGTSYLSGMYSYIMFLAPVIVQIIYQSVLYCKFRALAFNMCKKYEPDNLLTFDNCNWVIQLRPVVDMRTLKQMQGAVSGWLCAPLLLLCISHRHICFQCHTSHDIGFFFVDAV